MMENELLQLEKEREALAGKIVRLAIRIALIFALPLGGALLVHYIFGLRLVFLWPLAFLISWILVVRLYRKTDAQMRRLDMRIMALKKEQASQKTDQ